MQVAGIHQETLSNIQYLSSTHI